MKLPTEIKKKMNELAEDHYRSYHELNFFKAENDPNMEYWIAKSKISYKVGFKAAYEYLVELKGEDNK